MTVWALVEPPVETIVDVIEALQREELDAPAMLSKLGALGLCEEHAEQAVELVSHGFSRVRLYAIGMQPRQFSGDFEDDPLFLAAVGRACMGLGIPLAPRRPWWKFW